MFNSPMKIVMLFTSPRVLKFELDNSYSWVKSKTIKYKTNIFYPKYPYAMGHQVLVNDYRNSIINNKNKILKSLKKDENKKIVEDEANQLLILKIDGENEVFNCVNVKQNLDAINKMINDKYLDIISIYIKMKNNENNQDKPCFYYLKENEGLVEKELQKELFENYLNEKIINTKGTLNIINLYIINGDSVKDINDYSSYSVKKILGFEPSLKIAQNSKKILFLVQYLSQAQLLYFLYKQVYAEEPIDNVLLVNYSKYGGYQILLFNSEEIINNLNDFNGLNKSASIDENMKIISDGIKKLKEDERNVDIVLTVSFDDKENEITPEKMEEKIMVNIGDNEDDKKNIKIFKTDLQFNNELQTSSHIFYLDN